MLASGELVEAGLDFMNERDHIDLADSQVHLVIFNLTEIQELIDDASQAFSILTDDTDIVCKSRARRRVLCHLVKWS